MVARGGGQPEDVEVVTADLSDDAGWSEAVNGCRYVLHLASPFPTASPKDPEELVRPARDGALRVLRASREAGVERVVLTSSFAAIGYGHSPGVRAFTEADWTDPDAPGVRAYTRSKTLAERAAWDDVVRHGGPELAVINPVAVFGPVLAADTSSSIEIVRSLLSGRFPGVPRLAFGVVDVRDVADLHLRAMTAPEAAGERFLAVSGDFMTMGQIAGVLRQELGPRASKVPTRTIPDVLIRLAGLVQRELRDFGPELGVLRSVDGSKATRLLGWQPRSREDALVATAESLFDLGLI